MRIKPISCWLFLSLTISLCFCLNLKAQSPGGVSTGLQTWIKANAGVTGSNPITAWANQVGTGTAVVVNGSPTLNTTSSGYNYNPYIDFAAPSSPRQFLSLSGFNANTGINFRAVFITGHLSDLTRANSHIATTQSVSFGSPANGTLHGGNNGTLAAMQDGGGDADFIIANTWQQNGSVITYSTTHQNTKNIVSAVSQNNGVTTLNRFLGGQCDNGSFLGHVRDWRGPVAELVAYTSSLSAANRQRVETYLAVKYGVTLSGNYVNTAGTLIYTPTTTYTNNIIGIGRDDAELLSQKQSHTNDDTVRVYMSTLAASNSANTGTFAADLSYVMMGANSGKMCASAVTAAEIPTICTTILKRLDREWKITNSAFTNTYSIDFKLGSCAIPSSVTVNQLRLLVDDDGNFSSGVTTCYANGSGGLTFSYSNPVLTISGIGTSVIALNGTRYITIASSNTSTPLPITLTGFTGECDATRKKFKLKWQTQSELNNAYFIIEGSNNATDWHKLTTIEGAGNSTSLKTYEYFDNGINENYNNRYYRLKSVDFSDITEIIPTIVYNENCHQYNTHLFSPNPANNSISISDFENYRKYTIISGLGVILKTGDLNSSVISVAEFSNGIYQICLTKKINGETVCGKLIVDR